MSTDNVIPFPGAKTVEEQGHRVVHTLWLRLLPTLSPEEVRELGWALFRGGPINLDAVRKQERERCAKAADLEAERIKHTSHVDGLGMGDLAREDTAHRIAAAIRSLP